MYMDKLSLKLCALIAVLVGCGAPSEQVVTGRVATGFPSAPTAIRVVHNGQIVATSRLAADGSFRLAFTPSTKLALQVVTSGKAQLVFPRQAGGVKTTFSARTGGVPFDLGTIRFVANAQTTTFSFHNGPAEATDCHDGKDANGATCVDDDDNDHGTCEQEDESADDKADGSGGADDDVNDGATDEGDAVADHNFPADGCSDDDGGGSDDGSGSGSGSD
jgi:hypothetical protein